MDATRRWMRRVGGFAIVGCASTVIYATLAWYAAIRLGLPMPLASPAAYGLAAMCSFFGHRILTFRDVHPHPRVRTRFFALALAGYGTAIAVPAFVDGCLGVRPEWSIPLTCLAIPFANAVILSWYVFREWEPA